MADTDDISYFLHYLVVHNSIIRQYSNYEFTFNESFTYIPANTVFMMQRLLQSVMPYIYIMYFHSMVGDMCIDYFTIVLVSLNFQRCSNCIF